MKIVTWKFGWTVLIACALAVALHIQSALSQRVESPMRIDPPKFTLILRAALNGDAELLKSFSDRGQINSLDENGLSAVLHVVRQNRLDALDLLIEHGADIDAYDPKLSKNIIDQTAFLYAGANGNIQALEKLIAAGTRGDIYNFYGGTALIPAAEKGHVEAVQLLLETSDIDVNHINQLGWTALLEAVLLSDGGEKHQEIVRLLLRHGADPTISDRDGLSAIHHAQKRGYQEIVDLLTFR